MKSAQTRDTLLSSATLLTSIGTLLCCALPTMLVAVGAGAVVAGLVTAVPQIVFLSEHKQAVFTIASGLLATSAGLQYINRNAPCPADPTQAAICQRLRRFSKTTLYASGAVYAVGFFFAFLASDLLS